MSKVEIKLGGVPVYVKSGEVTIAYTTLGIDKTPCLAVEIAPYEEYDSGRWIVKMFNAAREVSNYWITDGLEQAHARALECAKEVAHGIHVQERERREYAQAVADFMGRLVQEHK